MIDDLNWAFGKPVVSGTIKHRPEDFLVEEQLGFNLSGSGEHICLHIEKIDLNSRDIVQKIARLTRVKTMDVGFAGLKDKHAVTRQWFSVYLPLKGQQAVDWRVLENERLRILSIQSNNKKIRRGCHRANSFKLKVRGLKVRGFKSDKKDLRRTLDSRIAKIKRYGVPNYFTQQRFGRNNDNVSKAELWFRGEGKAPDKYLRGIYLSAVRAFVFNQVLSKRISLQQWDQYITGDVMSLQGTSSVFAPSQWDDTLQQRLEEFDIHPSGPLVGKEGGQGSKGELKTFAAARQLELDVQQANSRLCLGLEKHGLKPARRSLRLWVENLQYQYCAENALELSFHLPPGCYATAVLRELLNLDLAMGPGSLEQ